MNIYTYNLTSSLNKIFNISCHLQEEMSDQELGILPEDNREYIPEMHPQYGLPWGGNPDSLNFKKGNQRSAKQINPLMRNHPLKRRR